MDSCLIYTRRLCSVLLIWTLVLSVGKAKADSSSSNSLDVQELGYDELVERIQGQKRSIKAALEPSLFDDNLLHFGVAWINGVSQFIDNGSSIQKSHSGLQISAGLDLFTPNWYSEIDYRNYGENTFGAESFQLHELDFKFGYKEPFQEALKFLISGGLSTRYLTWNNDVYGTSHQETTPAMLIGFGPILEMQSVTLGLEAQYRSPLVRNEMDRGGSALNVLFMGSF